MDLSGEYVVVCFHDLFHLFLLHKGVLCGGGECFYDLSFILKMNHEEFEFPYLGYYLPALLCCDERHCSSRKCLWYPVEFLSQINNDTTRPRIIHDMVFPHIRLS